MISFHVDGFDQRLSRYTLMFNRKLYKNSELVICVLLVLNRTANDHVFIAVTPIIGDAVHKSVNALCKKQKCAILALLDHLPAFVTPSICFLNQKIGRKTGIYNPRFHFVIAILQAFCGLGKVLCFFNNTCINSALCIALVDIEQ